MKQKLLNSIRLRLFMLLAVLVSGINAAWGDSYKLVKSVSELSKDDIILITSGKVGAVKALGPQTSNNCPAKDITISSETITDKGDAQEIVFDKTDAYGNFTFKVGTDLYLYAASSSNNYLKTQATGAYWKILINSTTYAATITDQSHTSNRNILRYNSGNKLFSCYSSGQSDVYIFKKEVAPAFSITAQSNNVDYGTVSLSGSTITATPAAGYRYASPAYTVSPANSATVSQNGNEFSVTPSENTTVTINFEAIPTYTVTLGDNSSTLTETSGGAGVTLPIRSDVSIYSFAGWSTTNVSEETTTAPTIIPAGPYHPTGNITLYPVYTKIVGAGSQNESASVTIEDYASDHSWSSGSQYTTIVMDENITVTGDDTGNNSKFYNSSTPHNWRFYGTNSGNFTIATTSGQLTSVTITYTGNTLKYGEDDVTSGSAVTVSGTSVQFDVKGSSGNSQVSAISVDYTIIDSGTTYYWSNPSAVNVTGVTLDQTSKALNVGDEFDLTATVAPNNATNKEVNWTSSNDALATVVDGHVTALAAGTPTITVTTVDGSFTATCNLTISNVAVTGVTLDKDEATIYTGAVGNTVQLVATVAPANATNKAVTWTSSEESVATVSDAGVVTAVAVGTTTITVTTTDGSFTATCDITVDVDPGSVEKPYTCAEAIAAQVAAGGDVTDKYVKGIVTKITGSTYWIADDGVEGNEQFECYNGLQEDGTTSINSTYLNVGDVVIAHGTITKYKTTYELAADNVVYSKTRPVVTITRNNNDYGTATLDVRTVTISPTEGYRLADPKYAVTGSATVVDNGDNTFSLSNIWDDCTIQFNFEAIPSHTLNYAVTPANAGTVTLGTSSVKEGATTSAEAAAEAGYKFIGWSITGTGASLSSTTTNPTTVTMGTTDATLTATFEAVTTYEINWSVNGSIVKTENVEEDADINFAAPMSGVPAGYTFKGWVVAANKIDTPTDTDPKANYVTSGKSTADITYYAVMAIESTSSEDESLTNSEITTNLTNSECAYGTEKDFEDGDITWTISAYTDAASRPWMQLKKSSDSYIKIEAPGKITALSFTITSNSNSKGGINDITKHTDYSGSIYVDTSAKSTPTGGLGSTSTVSSDQMSLSVSGNNNVVYMQVGSGARIWGIEVSYNTTSTSHYCTTVSDVPVKVGSAGYTTITTDLAVSFDGSGVTAYKATAVNPTTIHLEEVEEAPAGTPLVIKASEGTHMIDVVNSASAVTGNLLQSSDGSVIGDGSTIFALGVGKEDPYVGQVGFYLVKEEVAVPAGKAYLEVAAPGPGVKGFTFNFDDATAIAKIQDSGSKIQDSEIFNLAGQKMSKLQKGVNIVGGKKVLVK